MAQSVETKTAEEAAAQAFQQLDKESNSKGIRVFVYGTLKRGKSNHRLLENSTFLGRTAVKGKFKMVDLGWYPGVILNPDAKEPINLYGEVYRVSEETLDILDSLEGHPNYYCRNQIPTQWKKAWCYFLPSSFLNRAELRVVEPAVWRPDDEEKKFYMETELAEGVEKS